MLSGAHTLHVYPTDKAISEAFDIFEPRPATEPLARPAAIPRNDFSVNNRDALAVSWSMRDVKSMKGKLSEVPMCQQAETITTGLIIYVMLYALDEVLVGRGHIH